MSQQSNPSSTLSSRPQRWNALHYLWMMSLLLVLGAGNRQAQSQVDFENDIARVFAQACLKCHGPDDPEAGLDLTDPQSVADSEILLAGDEELAVLLQRLTTDDPDLRMPPEGPSLQAEVIRNFETWIASGAEWPVHWSYRPLEPMSIPLVTKPSQVPAASTPIDAFVDRSLTAAGLQRSPVAQRRFLIRRLYIDTLGLLPSPESVDEFVNDHRPDAWERLVDRVLASPHYGERWARRWMDLVHFAETHGHDQDRPREHAWPYRDYLIRSFNGDKPYQRFVVEQIAGDQFYPDDPWALVGLGMLAAGPWDESSLRDIREDSIDREKGRYQDRDDIVTTVMSTFASTSVHCARCHHHKFDPVSQQDYYGLQAVFASTDKANRRFDADASVAQNRRQIEDALAQVEVLESNKDSSLLTVQNRHTVSTWEQELGGNMVEWRPLSDTEAKASAGTDLRQLADGSWLAEGNTPDKEIYTVTGATGRQTMTAIRIELLPDESLPAKGPGRAGNGNLHINELRLFRVAADGNFTPLEIEASLADFDQTGWTLAMAWDGNPNSAWGIFPEVGKAHQGVLQLKQPIEMKDDDRLRIEMHQIHGGSHLVGRFRVSSTESRQPLDDPTLSFTPELRNILAKSPSSRTEAEEIALIGYVLRRDLNVRRAKLPEMTMVYSGTSQFEADGSFRPAASPREVHVLERGLIDRPLQSAIPSVPAKLFPVTHAASEAAETDLERRKLLARWLASSDNGLVWRSIVNRVWQNQFGQALVSTPNDFGHMGARPTHPELLDFLALELVRSEGSLKQLQRLMLCSSSYRQDSHASTAAMDKDRNNRLLWRMPRRRMDAESFRDSLLVASRALDTRAGGESVRAFVQSPGVHVTPVVDYGAYDLNDPGNRRRSVYRFIFRTIPDPLMEALDCPDASQLSPTRNQSVTVLQALATWNDRFVLHQCQILGQELEQLYTHDHQQCAELYRRLFGREPEPEEAVSLIKYANRYGWSNACRVLVNSNEFLFVD